MALLFLSSAKIMSLTHCCMYLFIQGLSSLITVVLLGILIEVLVCVVYPKLIMTYNNSVIQ